MNYRIGIDLGTTNCALASVACDDANGHSTILGIPQAETAHSTREHLTLPSFLYFPPETAETREGAQWVAGNWARTRAAEVPGRVVSSAKSWMVHHAADRRANFLPLGTTELPLENQLSPVNALASLLRTLAGAWDAVHPATPLARQDVAITVPASFDPVAQQLTLEAAHQAGFPETTILLEEPQAAFYAWMEHSGQELNTLLNQQKKAHVLVVDIGGGTTDLSLFSLAARPDSPIPHLQRIAVSDHLLLGGDNLDLALAHDLEKRLVPDGQLPASTFAQLISRSRAIKEEALEQTMEKEQVWPVAVARPGASLLAGTLRTEVTASELSTLLVEGFFPNVGANEYPLRTVAGLREMGLPYAKDPAITRHLAAFLKGRPPVDFLLFNGGLTKAPRIREKILENITRWQEGHAPQILGNHEPDLAVARGAARFLHLRAEGDSSQIEAGASHAYYAGLSGGKALCVLPLGAPAEAPYLAEHPGLRALINQPATFPLYRHARRKQDQSGSVVSIADEGFSELPPVETILIPPSGSKNTKNQKLRVKLRSTLRSTGLLRIELVNAEAGHKTDPPWPLEFALRKGTSQRSAESAKQTSSSSADSVEQAAVAMRTLLFRAENSRQKLTANSIFNVAEKILQTPKANWSGGMVRSLFDQWITCSENAFATPEQEESWLQVAGFLLRPGCGMTGDAQRVATFGYKLAKPTAWPGRAVKIQRWIAARRVAAGLEISLATAIWEAARAEWQEGVIPSAEIALLVGSLEALPVALRGELANRLADALLAQPNQTAFWKGLGRLLSRVLFHLGAEQVIAPECVETLWEKLQSVEVMESIRPEAGATWLRAARLTGLRPLDVSKRTRHQIQSHLKKWGFTDVRRRILEEVVPLSTSDQTSLLGESPPPGLSLEEG